jgi:type I restriction enzyme S subunit
MKVPISELFDFEKGTLQSLKCIPGKYTFITASEDWKTHNEFTHDCEALIFAMAASGSLGRTHYFKGKFISSDLCFILTPAKKYKGKLDLKFYYRIFNSLREDIVKKTKTGTSKQAINRDNFGKYELPYFDYDAQIKNRELFDELSEKKEFLFSELTTQQTLITQLRQSILQEAVQGKLVKQNKNDEPASELLKRIKAEKEKLIKQGKLKKEKPMPPISENETPYQLPEGWVWCRLGEIIYNTEGGKSPNCLHVPAQGNEWGVIKTTAIQEMLFLENENKVLPKGFVVSEQHKVFLNDLLITRAGPKNRVGIVCSVEKLSSNLILSDKTIRINHSKNLIYTKYIALVLNSPAIRPIIESKMTGMAESQVNISQDSMKTFLIPLPPLPEQKRIVEKVNQLMQHCNELEQQVQQSITHARQLMQAVLREVFEGKKEYKINEVVGMAAEG